MEISICVNMIILILCSAFLTSVCCAAENKDKRLSAWEDDLDWNIFPTVETIANWKPLTWKPFTRRPFTWKPVTSKHVTPNLVTRKHVTRKPVTKKHVTRKPVTKKPVTRKPVTREPVIDVYDRNTDNSRIYLVIFVIAIITTLILVLTCALAASSARNRDSPSTSSGNTTPRSSSVSTLPSEVTSQNDQVNVEFLSNPVYPPFVLNNSETASSEIPHTIIINRYEQLSTAVDTNSTIPASSRPERLRETIATEQPPGYNDVVLCDSGGDNKFPEVRITELETPPPKYDYDNVMKY